MYKNVVSILSVLSKLQHLANMWYHRGITHVQGLCFKLINIVVSLFALLVVFSFELTLEPVSNPSVGIWPGPCLKSIREMWILCIYC